jgi:hypothetical protein
MDGCLGRKSNGRLSWAIRVEIVLDPVHFCSSAMEARAKALNLMADYEGMQTGASLARLAL